MTRQHRQPVGADLIGEVAVGADPVGTEQHDIDFGLPHQRGRRGIGDQRARDSGVPQLPHREPGALEQRPRLVYVDMHAASLLVREIHRGERGADTTGRQRPGVAVREHIGTIGEDGETVLANPATHGAIFFPDRRRLDAQPLPQIPAFPRSLRGDAQHALERPAQIHGCRARRAQQRGTLLQTCQEVRARSGALLARGRDEPHRGGDADQRRAPYLQLPDGIRDRLSALEITCDLRFGQSTLIDDANGAGGRPGDCLDGHVAETKARTCKY